ncbi:hypothetical protein K438DRAFT_1717926 [Mycena galopus ATCC 62051]|nr:hypothetical protein K438DRAFT_1717926 [Mycena galopus ATCC 62051]
MSSCSICLEPFRAPVSLPCGHVFCRACIRRTVVQSLTKPESESTIQHLCPACRAPYSILNIDPVLVPGYLRPHIMPPIRTLFLDDPAPSTSPSAAACASTPSTSTSASTSTASPPTSPPTSSSSSACSPTPPSADPARASASSANAPDLLTADDLRAAVDLWRRRAHAHASFTTTLLAVTRHAKDCALRLRAERDNERNRVVLLKRRIAELIPELDLGAESPFTAPSSSSSSSRAQQYVIPPLPSHINVNVPPPPRPHAHTDPGALPHAGLPVFLDAALSGRRASLDQSRDGGANGAGECSMFGPPMKRRRCGASPLEDARATSTRTSGSRTATPTRTRTPTRRRTTVVAAADFPCGMDVADFASASAPASASRTTGGGSRTGSGSEAAPSNASPHSQSKRAEMRITPTASRSTSLPDDVVDLVVDADADPELEVEPPALSADCDWGSTSSSSSAVELRVREGGEEMEMGGKRTGPGTGTRLAIPIPSLLAR